MFKFGNNGDGVRFRRAMAVVNGSADYPDINGTVTFVQKKNGVLVTASISDLPQGSAESCSSRIFGFHIHEGNSCTGNAQDPFANAKTHYNPYGCAHPFHAGDLPPLFENDGYAYLSVLTNRFSISEIIGRTVIIHDMPDDFTSQPSGNSGTKIACGVISVF